MKFLKNIFAKESAIRHLIQLGITALVLVWSYIAMALLTGNWKMFSLTSNSAGKLQGLINVTGIFFILVFAAVFGCLTYYNGKNWMLPCLKRSGLYLLGIIPFINLLVPDEMMNSWWEEISDLNTSDGTVVTYYDRWGKLYSTDGSIPLLLAIPLGIAKALLKGISMSALNLIAAIGIPVLSPLSFVFGALATQLLIDANPTAALFSAIVTMAVTVLILVAHPVWVLAKSKTA